MKNKTAKELLEALELLCNSILTEPMIDLKERVIKARELIRKAKAES